MNKAVIELIEVWLFEFLKGVARFFLHPLVYFSVVVSLLIGFYRVKKERQSFHIRVYDIFHELRSLFSSGIIVGLVISVITVGLGIVLPFSSIAVIGIVTILLSFSLRIRWLSPAYTIGLSFFVMIFLPQLSLPSSLWETMVADFKATSLVALSLVLALLLLAEGFLIIMSGYKGTSPQKMKGKRGLPVGVHIAQKLWMVPIFFLMPGSGITSTFEWWPVFQLQGKEYALFLVPFTIGFQHKVLSMLPIETVKNVGRRVIVHGLLLVALAVAGIWYPVLAIAAASFAIVGRELISLQHRFMDDSQPFFYTKKDRGLLVLGVIPKSPADKMALQIGEVITKVNNISVNTVDDFYLALQKNRAFCKLEIVDTNGELRFSQRALYDGEHHELGILFVHDEKKWETEAV
ncbi:PDZ domain-containing protein [Bacillus timonensis]|nr:PDZ domain-containing protein [Bacillus timonensis]